jgi:hypothetical protein
MQFEIPKTDKVLTWEMEAHFTQGVEAKVPIGAATEISLKGFTIGVKAQPENIILYGPKGEKGWIPINLGEPIPKPMKLCNTHTHTHPLFSQNHFLSLSLHFCLIFYLASRLSICCLLG